MSGTRWISFNHLWVSLSSFYEILALVFVFHSKFDVGRSMFDVHFFCKPSTVLRLKNNLALMGGRNRSTKPIILFKTKNHFG